MTTPTITEINGHQKCIGTLEVQANRLATESKNRRAVWEELKDARVKHCAPGTLPSDADVLDIADKAVSLREKQIAREAKSAAKGASSAAKKPEFQTYTHTELGELVSKESSEDDVVEGIIAADSVNLIVGDSGLGKSPLLYQMGLCVAEGIPFLNLKTRKGGVLYVDYENGAKASVKLQQTISSYLGLAEVPRSFRGWYIGYSGEMNLEVLEEFAEKEGPALIIIDALREFNPDAVGSSQGDRAVADMFNRLREIGRKYHVAILIVHHTRKPGNGDQQPEYLEEADSVMTWLNEASGKRGLINHSDSRLAIAIPRASSQASEGELALVIRGFQRMIGEFGPIFVSRSFGPDGEPVGYRLAANAALLGNPDQQKALAKLPEEFTFKQAREVYGRQDSATTKFLKKAMSLGLLEKTSTGYRKISHEPATRVAPLSPYPVN